MIISPDTVSRDILSRDNNNNKKLLNTELYRASPLKFNTKTEFTKYLKLLVML
jgi:hypothetical protein